MHTPRRPSRRLARFPGLALAVLIVPLLAGCSSGAVASASPKPSTAPPSAAPSASPSAEPSAGVGTDPIASDPGFVDPAGALVVPAPGQLDVHPISAEKLTAAIQGRRVVITVDYTSGVAPCSILDSVMVQKGTGSFAITLREGHGPGDPICMMIAEAKRTQVDLGELEPGDYRISDATGGAPGIVVTVS